MDNRAQRFALAEGLTLIDSSRALRFKIEDRDIRGSHPLSPKDCAIARALRRKGSRYVLVFRCTVWVDDGKGHFVRYGLPPRLQREVHTYDRSRTFEPGRYHLAPCPDRRRRKMAAGGKNPRAKYRAQNRDYYKKNRERILANRKRRQKSGQRTKYRTRQTEYE